MSVTINGTTGVSLVQNGVLTDANMPAGSVLQVVSASTTTQTNTTSTSFVATSLSVSITPLSASNKIFIQTNGTLYAPGSGVWIGYTLYRGATNLGAGGTTSMGYFYVTNTDVWTPCAISYVDSPNTTSSTTYTVYIRSSNGTSVSANDNTGRSHITLMEIAG